MSQELHVAVCEECGALTNDRNVSTLPIDSACERALLHHSASGHVVSVFHEGDVHVPFPEQGQIPVRRPHGHHDDRFTPDHHTAAVGGNV